MIIRKKFAKLNQNIVDHYHYHCKKMAFRCNVCDAVCSMTCVCGQVSYCGNTCQKYDWKYHKFLCPKVSVQDVSNKGQGLIANRSIQRGEEIICDSPILAVNVDINNNYQNEVLDQYKSLPNHLKKSFDSLQYFERNGTSNRIVNTWITNQMSTRTHETEANICAVYPTFQKTNHSCAANAVINFDEEKNLTLNAVTRIRKGEEITVNYLAPDKKSLLLRFERQRNLRNIWQFTCDCPVCGLTGQELERNESLKTQLAALHDKQESYGSVTNVIHTKSRLSLEIAMVELMNKLGVECVREIPVSLLRCYLFSKCLQVTFLLIKVWRFICIIILLMLN